MKIDEVSKNLLLSQKEFNVISSSVAIFAQEMHWKLEASDSKEAFQQEFSKRYGISLLEFDYINDALCDLELNCRYVEIEKISICTSDETHIPKKAMIIYTAMKECSKNYNDYEISIMRGKDALQELNQTLNEFKEKVINILQKV